MFAVQTKPLASLPLASFTTKYFWFTRAVSWMTSGGTSRNASSKRPSKGTGHLVRPAFSITSPRSEEHTSELQALMRISYAVFCLTNKTYQVTASIHHTIQKHHE